MATKNTTKPEAIDVATFTNREYSNIIGYGNVPPYVYNDQWFKVFLPAGESTVHTVSVWTEKGVYYTPYPPPDDEWVPPPDAYPGAAYPCIVTVYDQNDVVLGTGKTVQFSSVGLRGTWVYLRVQQPAPHFPAAIFCWYKIRVWKFNPTAILIGTPYFQDEYARGLIFAHPAGYGGYQNPRNIVIPEDGHSIYGGAGDILANGVTCIVDYVAGGITVRNKYYRGPNTLPIGTTVYNIRRNADGYANFWVSYTEGGANKVRPLNIVTVPNDPTTPVTVSWGPVLGISAVVDRLCARAEQILYYVLQGSYDVKRWNIIDNIPMTDLTPNPGLGVVTDLLVLPDGSVLIGYNTGTIPTTYTVRRVDGLTGAHIRDYTFTSNGAHNRINYGEVPEYFYIWTHQIAGESQLRKVRIADGNVMWISSYREFENNKLVLDGEMYNSAGVPGEPAQYYGFTNKYNFWVSPVVVQPSGYTASGGGLLGIVPTQLPDDEYYPPRIGFPPLPGQPVPEVPAYPGYPWLPPPPDAYPPQTVPLPIKIGGGLIILDPENTTRHDVYLDQQGNRLFVAIPTRIRTAFLGD